MAQRPASGAFDTPIELQRAVETRDAFNAPVQSWTTQARPMAQRLPAGGGEALAGEQPAATERSLFRIRLTPKVADVSPAWRLRCAGLDHEIERVEPETGPGRRGRYLRLHAVALVAMED